MGMNSLNSESTNNPTSALEEGISRISAKLTRLQEELIAIQEERVQMEKKITDAQTRIHKILTRLPKPEDTRQMNLLDGGSEPISGEQA